MTSEIFLVKLFLKEENVLLKWASGSVLVLLLAFQSLRNLTSKTEKKREERFGIKLSISACGSKFLLFSLKHSVRLNFLKFCFSLS